MGKKKVIFYLIDGARPDILSKLIDEAKLPNIKEHLVDAGSFVKGTTCFPSTTGPAYLPYFTGAFPGDHDITGIRWFDKQKFNKSGRWSRNSMRSYCGYEAKYFNGDMNPRFPSLFEQYGDSVNLYNMVTKGLNEINDVTKKGKTKLYFNAHYKHHHHLVDLEGHKKLLASLQLNSSFTFAVFPSIDWDSHTYHFDDPATTHRAYKIVDDSLGELVDQLKKDGSYEDTLIVMASDHGLSSTHSHFDVGRFLKSEGYRVLEYPHIFKIKPHVALSVSGNSFASISFLDLDSHHNYQSIQRFHATALHNLVLDPAIDFVLMRDGENDLRVVNQEGSAIIKLNQDLLSYHIQDADVLDLKSDQQGLNMSDAFTMTFNTDYPDSLWQCYQLMKSDRAGDVIISAATGYDLRDFWEYPEHKGSHGSLHWEHMHIPILTNQKNLIDQPIRSVKVNSVIKDWLSEHV